MQLRALGNPAVYIMNNQSEKASMSQIRVCVVTWCDYSFLFLLILLIHIIIIHMQFMHHWTSALAIAFAVARACAALLPFPHSPQSPHHTQSNTPCAQPHSSDQRRGGVAPIAHRPNMQDPHYLRALFSLARGLRRAARLRRAQARRWQTRQVPS